MEFGLGALGRAARSASLASSSLNEALLVAANLSLNSIAFFLHSPNCSAISMDFAAELEVECIVGAQVVGPRQPAWSASQEASDISIHSSAAMPSSSPRIMLKAILMRSWISELAETFLCSCTISRSVSVRICSTCSMPSRTSERRTPKASVRSGPAGWSAKPRSKHLVITPASAAGEVLSSLKLTCFFVNVMVADVCKCWFPPLCPICCPEN
mmetsp:Transcript_90636/g.194351  ORF Transcript_90636/g.194351 Transcript_90636/m.194351 type:complete len:213 (+) Transcript_90636:351-989(+)